MLLNISYNKTPSLKHLITAADAEAATDYSEKNLPEKYTREFRATRNITLWQNTTFTTQHNMSP